MPRDRARSVSASTALVASSRTSRPGVGELGPGQRHQLPLADREAVATLADRGVEPVGQPRQPPVEAEVDEATVGSRRRWRRLARGARSRRSVASKRNPSWGTSRMARDRDAGDTSRRSTPPTHDASLRRIGEPAQQLREASSCPSRSRRRSPRWRRPGSRGRRRDSTGSPSSYSNCDVLHPHLERRRAPGRPRARGSTTSIGVSSRSRILRQPASAVCVWSSTSPISPIGVSSRLARNRKATTVASRQPPARSPPHAHADDRTDRDRRRRCRTSANSSEKNSAARMLRPVLVAGSRRRRARGPRPRTP